MGVVFKGWLVYNAIVALVFAVDKALAVHGMRRISERTLFALAATFGAPGAMLGMRLAHHKTRKPLFAVGITLLLFLQIAIVILMVKRRV